jgi:stage II sporulation protein R
MKKCKTIKQSKQIVTKNIKTIKKIALKEVRSWNRDYTVDVYIGESKFPTKRYGDLVFPAGKYDALQVVLGKGKGQNWWCVMFPPLCLTDVVAGSVPYNSKKKIKDVIGSKYYVIIDQGNKKKHKAKVIGRFKSIELLENVKKRLGKWINGK